MGDAVNDGINRRNNGEVYNPNPTLIVTGVNPIGMSYWRNINNHAHRPNLLVALSINDVLQIITVRKSTLEVIGSKSLDIPHTGEGIYFSSTMHDVLYVPLDGVLIAVNVYDDSRRNIWKFNGHKLWQIHSNYYENIHSATIKDSDYNTIGWGIYHRNETVILPINGSPDECQIDKSGRYLFVKEDDNNRIINIETNTEIIIGNEAGALGHSDCGQMFAIGENDYSDKPGALDMINFETGERKNIYSTGIWNMGYVSLTGNYRHCLLSTPTELVKVDIDSGIGTKVCNHLTQSEEYPHRVKANLCPVGEYAAWTAFVDGSLNAYVIRI